MDKPQMKKIKNETFATELFNFTNNTDLSFETDFPDYYPEIKKIISVSAEALPDSKYITDDRLEYGGTVSFSVLYIGDDETVSCVSLNEEYSTEAQINTQNIGTGDIHISTFAENVQCRVLAPRKISLRTRLKSTLCAGGYCDYGLTVKNENGEEIAASLEKLSVSEPTVFCKWANQTGHTDGVIDNSTDIKPIMCGGNVFVNSVKTQNGAVTVSGYVEVRLLGYSSQGLYKTITGNLPFEESVTVDGVCDTDIAASFGKCASVSISTDENGISADVEFDLDVKICAIDEVTVINDLFSTEYETQVHREEIKPISLACCQNGQITVSGDIRRPSPVADSYIIHTEVLPSFEKVDIKDNKISFFGSCRFKVFSVSNGDVICDEGTLPIKYETDSMSNSSFDIIWSLFASPVKISAKFNGDKINVSSELSIMAEAVKQSTISPISEVALNEKLNCNNSCSIKLCFAQTGTSVWDIAKKYHASLHDIERINGISKSETTGSQPIIIK